MSGGGGGNVVFLHTGPVQKPNHKVTKTTNGPRSPNLPPAPGTTETKYINFYGFIEGTSYAVSFSVMPGDGGPMVTGGFPLITSVPRPQRTSLTIFNGYSPVTIDIPILFDCINTYKTPNGIRHPEEIEESISKLEWMYGRGAWHIGVDGGKIPSMSGTGQPPIINVTTSLANGPVIPLLSPNYQNIEGKGQSKLSNSPQLFNSGSPNWWITNVAWDPNPLRAGANEAFPGCRIRQAATVTIQQHVSDPYTTVPGTGTRTAPRSFTHTTKAGETYYSIAHTLSGKGAWDVATRIMLTNKTNRKLRSIRSVTKLLPPHVVIRITSRDLTG